jgi:hypothetical protein
MSSPKYSTGRSARLLRDRNGGQAALTDHALHRWQGRTPHECPVSVQEAWHRGEFIKHPAVARSDGEDQAPDDVRVYRHGDQWGVAFLVVADPTPGLGTQNAERIVCTIAAIQTFNHGPVRAYLHGYGPHHQPEGSEDTQ